jgi:hypothetical protein
MLMVGMMIRMCFTACMLRAGCMSHVLCTILSGYLDWLQITLRRLWPICVPLIMALQLHIDSSSMYSRLLDVYVRLAHIYGGQTLCVTGKFALHAGLTSRVLHKPAHSIQASNPYQHTSWFALPIDLHAMAMRSMIMTKCDDGKCLVCIACTFYMDS